MRFDYTDLCALMPGVTTPAQWRDFAADQKPAETGDLPVCPAPMMIRRRMTALGKLALSALAAVKPLDQESVVYASSWGEVEKTKRLTEEVVTDAQSMSPAGFSSSVHNAIAGTASIWLKNHAVGPAVSAGTLTTEAALVQCAALLAAGAPSVVLLRYDEPLPCDWQARAHGVDAPSTMYAWAMRLVKMPEAAKGSFELFVAADEKADVDTVNARYCPADLKFFLGAQTERIHTDRFARGWVWHK